MKEFNRVYAKITDEYKRILKLSQNHHNASGTKIDNCTLQNQQSEERMDPEDTEGI